MPKQTNIAYMFFLTTLLVVTYAGCKKAENTTTDSRTNTNNTPVNPFDNVVYNSDSSITDTLTKGSLASIHKNIFITRCALPGCHDGNFEPDFRTLESTYSTLVYHPVIKNTADSLFTYRVVPNDTAKSVLHERLTNCCFVNTNDRMPQDNIGNQLEQKLIDEIAQWILEGAKNSAGEVANKPDNEPQFKYFALYNNLINWKWKSSQQHRIDTTTWASAVILNKDSSYVFIPSIEDDNTELKDFKNMDLKFSLDMNDFSNPILTIPGEYIDTPWYQVWQHQISPNTLPKDKIIYMRYYMNDGVQTKISEYPEGETHIYQKLASSIIVKK